MKDDDLLDFVEEMLANSSTTMAIEAKKALVRSWKRAVGQFEVADVHRAYAAWQRESDGFKRYPFPEAIRTAIIDRLSPSTLPTREKAWALLHAYLDKHAHGGGVDESEIPPESVMNAFRECRVKDTVARDRDAFYASYDRIKLADDEQRYAAFT